MKRDSSCPASTTLLSSMEGGYEEGRGGNLPCGSFLGCGPPARTKRKFFKGAEAGRTDHLVDG